MGLKIPDSILTKEELAAALLGEQTGQKSDSGEECAEKEAAHGNQN
jgi:hypothetical protein